MSAIVFMKWKFQDGTQILGKRCRMPMYVVPPHELISEDYQEGETIQCEPNEELEDVSLLEAYWQHAVVAESASPVLPISVFIDAAPYSYTDSVIGFWVRNEISIKKTLGRCMEEAQLLRVWLPRLV